MEKRRRRNGIRLQRNEKRALRSLGILFACTVVLISIVYLLLYLDIRKCDKRIIVKGVSIDGTEVSGLTAGKAAEKVEKNLSRFADQEITFRLDDGREVSVKLQDLGLTIKDLEEVAKNAADYGKKGNVVNNYTILKKSEKGKLKKDFPVEYQISPQKAEEILIQAFEEVLQLPQNAELSVDGSGEVVLTKEVPGELPDVDKTIQSVNEFMNNGWDGRSGTVSAFLSEEPARITTKDLEGMTDLLGTYTTFYGSDGSGRAQNIEVGTKLISDVILKPGEEYSVAGIMGPNTIENGFAEADSYAGDEVVTSVGGGVCQVATTLYNAVLLAELEVTERSPHTMTVGYVLPSMDAAIAEDVLDLKFVNNQDSPVFVQGVLFEGNLTFNIFGKETRDPGRSIEYISEVTDEVLPDTKKYKATDSQLGAMYTISGATPAITAQLIKVVYENGEEVSREIVNYSQYLANREVIGVGTFSYDPDITSRMENAVSSQSEDIILQTIAELAGEG